MFQLFEGKNVKVFSYLTEILVAKIPEKISKKS